MGRYDWGRDPDGRLDDQERHLPVDATWRELPDEEEDDE